jgi:hypothetical protein
LIVGDVTMIRTFFVNDHPVNEASTAPMDMNDSPELSPPSPPGVSCSIAHSPHSGMASEPVHRSRGRPRREAPNFSQEILAAEPKRKLRVRKDTKAVSEEDTKAVFRQDPWDTLTKAPALTPPSPKKRGQAKAPQRPPRRPVNLDSYCGHLSFAYHIQTGISLGTGKESQQEPSGRGVEFCPSLLYLHL